MPACCELPVSNDLQFSPSLIQHLSDLPTPGGDNSPSTTRQTTLDEHIRARINSELARLKAEEAEIQERIARELEKENLDKEGASAKDDKIKSSTILQQELADLSSKISVNREKRDVEKNFPEVHKARSSLLACYKAKQDRPLDCWYEAAEFRLAVKKAEQVGTFHSASRYRG
jgi:altered-inheritance-of-mitochondria protein 13